MSISSERFRAMRDEMIPEIVLSRLRSRDELHILQIDSDPQGNVKVVEVSARQIGLGEEIASIYSQYVRAIEQAARYRGETNIGGVLAYANRIALKLQANGSQAGQVVVLLFSDGKLEGPQPKPRGEWLAGIQVWFWGIEREHEETLSKWARQKMQLGEEQMRLVLVSNWQTDSRIFGQKINRRFQNQQFVQRLQVSG
jgi:hypothetical protein